MQGKGASMKDILFKRLKDADFSNAKPVSETPAVAKLQKKERITIRLDPPVLAAYRAQAEKTGSSYQALINDALKAQLQTQDVLKTIRQTIRREIRTVSS
jgi:uncharacterized protein (DUF4415 family)